MYQVVAQASEDVAGSNLLVVFLLQVSRSSGRVYSRRDHYDS